MIFSKTNGPLQKPLAGSYFLGKYFTLLRLLKSKSCVQMIALNACAVARTILSANGRLCSRLSFEAAMANGALRSTTVPFCIATTACRASFSLDYRRMTLNTSYIVTVGQQAKPNHSAGSGNAWHSVHLRSMQASRRNLRYSYSIFLSFEFRMNALDKSTEFFDVPFRYKFNPSGIFDNLHFLARTKV